MRSMDMLQSGNLKVRKKIREISHKATESKRSVQFIVKKKTDPPVVLPATTLPGVVFKAAPFYERITTILGPVDLGMCTTSVVCEWARVNVSMICM